MTQETESKARIFYVEDDETLSFVTKDHLEMHGYSIHHCADGQQAIDCLTDAQFDIAILDVMLPGIDGFEIAQRIRERNESVPILFLTAKSMKEDRLEGFKTGGDDYITKPFSIEELLMRIEVFLKRRNVLVDEKSSDFKIGKFQFDFENLTLTNGSESATLTKKEAELLRYFVTHPNRVLKRSEILTRIWGEDDYFLGRSLDVFISRLRKYLKDDDRLKIENLHGVGFKFIVPTEG